MRASALPIVAALVTLPVLTSRPLPAQQSAPSVPPVAAANNAFAADLYRALATQKGSLFFSPYSISTALAMTQQGARGATREEMDRVFHWTDAIAPADHKALVAALAPTMVRDGWGEDAKQVPAFALHVANALWAQQGLAVERPFTSALADGFGAPLERLDFSNPAHARAVINRWVAEHTEDRIRDIVPEGLPRPDTLLALANAIWFKAAWQEPFHERATKDAPFTTGDGRTVDVPLMWKVERYAYAEDEKVQVLELPYRGGQTSMLVVLPKARDGLAAVEQDLTGGRIDRWVGKLGQTNVSVKLPKFEVTLATDLTDVLPAMGMPSAFRGGADFSGMTDAPLMIGAVLHKAFVAVDEKGTEAAAATVVMMEKGGMPRDPVAFTADHPFLFLIRHRATDTILFLGRYAGPK